MTSTSGDWEVRECRRTDEGLVVCVRRFGREQPAREAAADAVGSGALWAHVVGPPPDTAVERDYVRESVVISSGRVVPLWVAGR